MFQGQGCTILYQLKIKPRELEYYLETISFPAFNYLHAELSKFANAFFFQQISLLSSCLNLFYICNIKVSRGMT